MRCLGARLPAGGADRQGWDGADILMASPWHPMASHGIPEDPKGGDSMILEEIQCVSSCLSRGRRFLEKTTELGGAGPPVQPGPRSSANALD